MKLKNKPRFYTFISMLVFVLTLSIYALVGQSENNERYIEYTVGTDENLYQIIHEKYDTSKIDYREIEYAIGKVNGLKYTGLIQAGQTLQIPVEHMK